MLQSAMIRSALLVLFCSIAPATYAYADESKRIEVPAGELVAALESLARQCGIELVYQADQLKGIQTSGVSGLLSPREAVTKLLEGTSLRLRTDETTGAMLISGPTERSAPTTGGVPSVMEGAATEEILVTGSHLSDPSAQVVRVRSLSREEIERSGGATVGEVLGKLPQASTQTTEAGGLLAGSTTVQLRGLERGTTLVLLNGRRVGTSSIQPVGNFFDLNNVPLAAVDRIDVVATGSSAIYGGDAIGGVVNFVLRNDIDGWQASASTGYADGTDQTQAALGGGWHWGSGSMLVLGNYLTRTALVGSERAITANGDYRNRPGGIDRRTPMANPANVHAISGNLPGLATSFAAVPVGSSGVGLTPASFQGTAGTLNFDTSSAFASIIPESERYGFMANFNQEIGREIETFVELMYSDVAQVRSGAPRTLSRVLVPAANIYNPFGVDVRVDYGFEFPFLAWSWSEFHRALAGLKGSLADSWRWEVAGWTAHEYAKHETKELDVAAVNASLLATAPAEALNVFQDGPGASPGLLESLFDLQTSRFKTRFSAANAVVRGSAFAVPAGAVKIAAGAEYADDAIERDGLTFLPGKFGRTYQSAFGEVAIPLLGSAERQLVIATGALRYDDYSDFGGATSPQAGLLWNVTDSIALKAAYGEAFKPPSLFNLNNPRTSRTSTVNDPRRGNEVVSYTQIIGGNPQLVAETGDTTVLGIVLRQDRLGSLGGIELGATGFKLNYENRIQQPSIQAAILNDDPNKIVRAAPTPADVAAGFPGRIASIDITVLNMGRSQVRGVDLFGSATIPTPLGKFSPGFEATYVHKYEAQSGVGEPITDRAGRFDFAGYAPKWKGSLSLVFDNASWTANVNGHYVGSYDFPQNLGGATLATTLGDVWFVDAGVGYRPFNQASDNRSSVLLSLRAVNVLDREPDFAPGIVGGWDQTQYDLRGRYLEFRVQYESR